MSHLSLETIARLVEEAPTPEESAHLESCATCRADHEAMQEDVHALGLLPDMMAAPDQWQALEARLTSEGIIHARRPQHFGGMRLLQVAAALVLFIGGSMAGRMTAPERASLASLTPDGSGVVGQPPAPAPTLAADPRPEPVPDAQQGATEPTLPAPQARPNVTLATNRPPAQPRSLDEAAELLRQTEDLYLAALTRYAELASQADAGDPIARLAALQSIIMTTQAALTQMPTDPVINGYHLTALAQRDATLRQVSAASGDRWY